MAFPQVEPLDGPELDRLITAPVSVTPPANWQPGQQQQAAAPAAAPTQQQPSGR
jgi:hypothetical protein